MSALSVLQNRRFFALFVAQLVSLIGTGLATVALALMVYRDYEASAGLVLGWLLAAKMAAYITVAPVVGAYVEKFPRKLWLSSVTLIRAVVVALLPLVSAVFVENALWPLLFLIVVLNVMAASFTPVFQALLPEILPDEKEYTKGLALSRVAMEIESLLSPSLAAFLLLFVSYKALFWINSAAFVIAAVMLFVTNIPQTTQTARVAKGFIARVSFGIRSYLATPKLRSNLGANFVISAAGAMVIVNTVVYVQNYLGLDEVYVPVLLALGGLGSMVMAFALPSLLNVWSVRSVTLVGASLNAFALFAIYFLSSQIAGDASLDSLYLVAPFWALIGAGGTMVLVASGQIVNASCNEQDRNDYFAANFSLTHAMWLICYLLAGTIGDSLGIEHSFLVMGAIALFACFAIPIFWSSKDKDLNQTLWHEHPATEHEHLHYHDEHHQHWHDGTEGPEPHSHEHRHGMIRHRHKFVIDEHHLNWPSR